LGRWQIRQCGRCWRLGRWLLAVCGQGPAFAACCRSCGRIRGHAVVKAFAASSHACPTFRSTGRLTRYALQPPVSTTLGPALIMTRTSSTSFSSKASCHSGCLANAGIWAADGAASFGKRKPVRYAAVRVGAGAVTQTAGLRGKFTRVAQHLIQADALTRTA
jgi:hypothetical protein